VVGAFSAQHAPNVAFRACLERWKQDLDDIALEELGTTPRTYVNYSTYVPPCV
jgi:hypothetical protein